jgi:hypothetical protein
MSSVTHPRSFVAPAQPGNLYPFSATRAVEDIRVGILTIREKWELLLADVPVEWTGSHPRLDKPWDIFTRNQAALIDDFELITAGRTGSTPDISNHCLDPGNIFIEPGARVRHSILNAEQGPIYIGRNAEVMEGCLIRGPFSMGEGAVLKMGA